MGHAGLCALDAALTELDHAGAERDSARVRRKLRELGARRRRQRRADPASRYAGLTDSELAVVRLVAAAATNRDVAERLYLSPHTVSSHLRHVFEKLQINSRVELAAIFARHEGDTAADLSRSR
jgi:DNA-binding CsgD family transcriptional regulator